MSLNPKIILGIAVGITGIVTSFGVLCKNSDNTKKAKHKRQANLSDNIDSSSDSSEIINEMSTQTEAEFINTINTIRLNQLLQQLSEIEHNQENAKAEILALKKEIKIILASNRGGQTGMHGFIGESCQVHIANIKSFIKGEKPLYVLLDDNSMTDYKRGLELIQQKACQSDNHLGLDHIKRHMEKYPEFIIQNGIYQIPKDFYQKYEQLRNTPANVASKFRKEELRLWKAVNDFTSSNPNVKIEPMEVTYKEIQAGNVGTTISEVEKDTKKEFDRQKNVANDMHSPSLEELIKVSAISGILEGALDATFVTIELIMQGKALRNFDKEDRNYILKHFGYSFIRGFIRASITYVLTTICKVSSNIAATLTSIILKCIKNTYTFIKKGTSNGDYIKNLLWDLSEIIISAIGAHIGKASIKKKPILGSIIGSLSFSTAFRFAKKYTYA